MASDGKVAGQAARSVPPSAGASTPPPESPASIWTRRVILLAFWTVIVALGLPHWVWATSIHRSRLPLQTMNEWADGRACDFHYPIHIQLNPSSMTGSVDTTKLVEHVQALLNSQNDSPLYSFHVSQSNSTNSGQHGESPVDLRETAIWVNFESDTKIQSTQASMRSWLPILDVRHNPERSVDAVTLAPFIVDQLRSIFADEQKTVTHLLRGRSPRSAHSDRLTPESETALDARRLRAFKYASTYHLTFSLFTASASPSAWDFEDAYREYMMPLINHLSNRISKLTIDTQVQLYASLSPSIDGPHYDDASREWRLGKTSLSGFINAAEWPLSPGIGAGPTINFVLYIPSPEQSPLVLSETGGHSWLIPQWGGVQILNPTGQQRDKLTSDDLRPIMLTFADQLMSLLGVPSTPSSLSMRVSSLARERTAELALSASSTLGALARLSLRLTSIAIPDLVAKSVDEAIHRLDQSCKNLQAGRYEAALDDARIAEEEAERAFFEPSMVGQVYFPDEHKVAVYVPLLGPMAVPLVMAGIKELRKLKARKAKTS